MAAYTFQTITAAEAAAYNGAADSLSLGPGAATQASVAYLAGDQAAVSFGGLTVNFGSGIFGDLDVGFTGGGMLFVGGAGADNAAGGAASDALFGGASADTLVGSDGSDVLQGNQGADSLSAGAGNDSVFGGQDGDQINLGSAAGEANWTNGNKGDDTIIASNGVDTILGGQGNDVVIGGTGGDLIVGNLGDDTIQAASGADTLIGEGGYDVMAGGGGADPFVFAAGSSAVDVALADRILDWSTGYRLSVSVTGGYMELGTPSNAPPPMPAPYDPYGGGYTYAPAMSESDAGRQSSNVVLLGDDGSAPQAAPSTPSAAEFAAALSSANSALAGNAALRIIATQSGPDVTVFVDTDADHAADLAIVLTGASLDSIDASNFV